MNIFCSNILRSLGENSDSLSSASTESSGKSKNKYKHFTSVEGTDAAVITSAIDSPSVTKMFNVDNRSHPFPLDSSDSLASTSM